MLHDRLDGSRGVGLREQLVADAAGIAALLQMCEHLRVVDLARARLVAARCVSHMDMAEGIAVVGDRVADAALVDLHMIYIIQQLETRAADQANDLGAHLGGCEEVADVVGGDVQRLEIEIDLLLLCKLCTARVKDVANDSYFSRKAGAFAPAFSKRLTTGGALGEGSQNDTIYSAQRKIY